MAWIYQITNTVTGKHYIGSTFDLTKRWNDHKNKLRKGTHFNIHLQRAYNKYTESAFVYSIIEECENDKYFVEYLETVYIQAYVEKYGSVYNIVKRGKQNKGMRMSLETRERISTAVRKWQSNPEYRKKVSEEALYWFSSEKNKELHKLACKKALSRPEVKENNRLKRAKVWKGLVSPTGQVYKDILDLKRFAQEQGIGYKSLARVASGVQEVHKGWRMAD